MEGGMEEGLHIPWGINNRHNNTHPYSSPYTGKTLRGKPSRMVGWGGGVGGSTLITTNFL